MTEVLQQQINRCNDEQWKIFDLIVHFKYLGDWHCKWHLRKFMHPISTVEIMLTCNRKVSTLDAAFNIVLSDVKRIILTGVLR